MTLALLVHHSHKLLSHPHGRSPTLEMILQAPPSNNPDTDSAYLLKTKQKPKWLKPIPDDERPVTPEPAWVIPTFYIPDAVNNWANALATMYQAPAENSLLEKTMDMRIVKPFYPDVVNLQFQMEECHKMLTDQIDWANPEGDQVRIDISKPLPLSGPPGHVTIQTQFFFNKDLDYSRYGSKGSEQALLISKMKAVRYHEFGLELLLPEHMWIDDVCTYDISSLIRKFYTRKIFIKYNTLKE
ncbi:hypothetical protein Tco_0061657 [Tanacetum coccineum]